MSAVFPDARQAAANNALLDVVAAQVAASNDAQLARALGSSAPIISKIRHGRMAIGATLQVAMIEHCDIALWQIRQYVPPPWRAAGQEG